MNIIKDDLPYWYRRKPIDFEEFKTWFFEFATHHDINSHFFSANMDLGNLLHLMARNEMHASFKKVSYLIAHGINIEENLRQPQCSNVFALNTTTPFQIAVLQKNFNVAKTLFQHGANVEGFFMCLKNCPEAKKAAQLNFVKYLLENGVQVPKVEEYPEHYSIIQRLHELQLQIMKEKKQLLENGKLIHRKPAVLHSIFSEAFASDYECIVCSEDPECLSKEDIEEEMKNNTEESRTNYSESSDSFNPCKIM